MFVRRLTVNLKKQNWTAITLDFLIVVLGVFVGIQASNWNQQRLSRSDTGHLLKRIEPQIAEILAYASNAREYYSTTRRYAEIAFAGWRSDPKVNDNDFVIAAYQASQVHGLGATQSWAAVFGADQLRNINDDRVRIPLARLMTFDTPTLNAQAVASKYREDVRRTIPDDVQQAIRKHCGDRLFRRQSSDYSLPQTCPLRLDPAVATEVASELRANPELARELRLHLALVSVYLINLTLYEEEARLVRDRLALLNR